ncbi:MAG: tetratricopeptide repeat protein [Desulfovibrio sp.]|nr:tetratricopeptide repeat protein [Desulfovibrio sp.]
MNKISSSLVLGREDIIEMEGMLCEQLSSFISFSGHALYFPTEGTRKEPALLAHEHRLLLPLYWEGSLLGVCMLHGIRAREVRPLLPMFPAITDLCLHNMAFSRALRTDALTGLATEETLLSRMDEAANRLRAWLESPGGEETVPAPLHVLCMGLVVVRLVNGPSLVRGGEYAFAQKYLRALADTCRRNVASDVTVARVGRWEFALLFPAAGREACRKLAESVLKPMDGVTMTSPLLKREVCPRLCAGHALYPQDMLGVELKLDMYDQARRCMDRARLAADVAEQRSRGGRVTALRVVPFARILQEGGVVLESLPLGRLRISVGRQAKAREGMRFAVWSGNAEATPQYRGEVVILRMRDTDAVAEALSLADASSLPQAGDRLVLLGETPVLDLDARMDASEEKYWPSSHMAMEAVSALSSQHRESSEQRDREKRETAVVMPVKSCSGGEDTSLTRDLHGHGDFLHSFAVEAESCHAFVLALLRLEDNPPGIPTADSVASPYLTTIVNLWRSRPVASAAGKGSPMVGLYGSNGLMVFHPECSAGDLVPLYTELWNVLDSRKVAVSIGVAEYPFLQYRRGEMPDCALKALEYARLLPEPRVGVCNSLALNISADRRYSLGDVFGAVEEYKQALLVDEDNAMARNSLGVCMAALGRGHEARRYFLDALKHKPDSVTLEQIFYNLGSVCQTLGERRAAARYYRRCIQLAPDHLFAHIRLGQLYESSGRRTEARRYYEKAAAFEDRLPDTPGVARRYLARVAVRQRKGREARELLHEALTRNPQDAASMLMLANIYLDSKEDPAIAELLARKSAGLHDRPEAWKTLARALRVMNREDEARVAEARAVLF